MMKMTIKIPILFLLLVGAQSCLKTNSPGTIVTGVVTNRITGEPVKNIPIEIIEAQGWTGKYLTTTQTVLTDAAGRYKTAIKIEKGKSYKAAVGVNPVLANSPYPYYDRIERDKENVINYAQFPLKTLEIRFKISDHQKNWLQIGFQACDGLSFYANDLYFGSNPVVDFDTTYHIRVQAGRKYRAYVGLSNKVAPYTYQDNEFTYKFFDVENVDTTSFGFILP